MSAEEQKMNEDVDVIEIKMKKPDMTFSTDLLPRSKLFDKTQSMLEQLKKSNNELKLKMDKMGAQSVSIENFDPSKDAKKPHIDMDLYLGILEEKSDKIQQQNVKAATDKLLGVNHLNDKQKKTIIITDNDSSESDQDVDL